MIRVDGLRYRYPGADADALAGIDLAVRDGEMLLIAGASGSGKSTLARALVGLVPHFHGGTFAGSVEAYGRDTRSQTAGDLADVVAFVAQEPESQSVVDGVADEIVFTMENLGVPPLLMRKRLEEVLDALGLTELRERRLDSLSGGERQRVAIAAALAAQPRCLVLDEPTSQLDPQSAEDVLAALHRLNTDLGLTIVLVEHRLERVVQHADRMIVLRNGAIVDEGAPRDVLARGRASTPLSTLARALDWSPMPLTVRDGRAFAAGLTKRLRPREHRTSDPGEVVVDARGLRVALGGRDVLRDVDLRVRRGETVAIVGRNGSGKTTLLRTMLGLLSPRAGVRAIAGLDPAVIPVEQLAARVAYVPQSADSILFHDTVRAEVRFTLAARAPAADPDELLAETELAAFAGVDPRDLSAGQRLRVALLAATAGDPDVVLLDEPTRGMDADGKERLARQMAAWRARGAVLLVTHDVELIARVATRVVLLSSGSLVLDGPVREVLGESPLFSSQMNKVFGDRRVLTVGDALEAVGAG